MRKALFLLSVAMVWPILAQTRQVPQQVPKKAPDATTSEDASDTTDLSTSILKFEKGGAVPGLKSTGAWITPVPCNADGTLFLSMVPPFDPSKPNAPPQFSYYAIGAKETHTFSMSAISDLHDVQPVGLFPSDSAVAFLVNATKESQLTPSSRTGADGQVSAIMVNRGKRHPYIAIFDLNGAYKESIELPMDYQIFRFAFLSSGKFVIVGYDRANNVPRLLLLDSNGQVERPIQLPQSIAGYDAADGHDFFRTMMAALKAFGGIEFTAFRGGVLVWRPGHTDPVIEVGAEGAVRELPIAYPKGFVLADFVPSDRRLILHVQPANLPEGVAHDRHTFKYYEVDQGDGSIRRQFSLSDNPNASIFCESGDEFISLQADDKGKLARITAN